MSSKREVKPVKQFIVCECDAKFLNEADLKIHLDFQHRGENEVKVRVQKVYINNEPKVKVETLPGNSPKQFKASPKQHKSPPKESKNSGKLTITSLKECKSSPKQYQTTPIQEKNSPALMRKTVSNTDVLKAEKNEVQHESVSRKNANAPVQGSMTQLKEMYGNVIKRPPEKNATPKKAKPIIISRNKIQNAVLELEENEYGTVSGAKHENANETVVTNSLPSKQIVIKSPKELNRNFKNVLPVQPAVQSPKPIIIPKSKIIPPKSNVVRNDPTQPMFLVMKTGDNKFVVQNNSQMVLENTQNNSNVLRNTFVQNNATVLEHMQNSHILQSRLKNTVEKVPENKTVKKLPVVKKGKMLPVINIKKPVKYYPNLIIDPSNQQGTIALIPQDNVLYTSEVQTNVNTSSVPDNAQIQSLRKVRKRNSAQMPPDNPDMVVETPTTQETPMYMIHNESSGEGSEHVIYQDASGQQYIVPKTEIMNYIEEQQSNEYITEMQDTSNVECKEEIVIEEVTIGEEHNEDDEVQYDNDDDGNKSEDESDSSQTVEKSGSCQRGEEIGSCQISGPNKLTVDGPVKKEYYFCDVCGKTSETERAMRYHKARYHKIKTQKPKDPTMTFKCDLCDNEYQSERSVILHKAKTHKIKRTNNDIHNLPKKFVCDECGRGFAFQFQLGYHKRMHTGEKPFACQFCPKAFTNKSFLALHTRVHTGEKPFPCNLCDKRFIGQGALWRHRKVHTGEKPYSCPQCGKTFSQSNSMKLHVMTVHLKQPTPYKSRRRVPMAERLEQDRKYGKNVKQRNLIALDTIQDRLKSQASMERSPSEQQDEPDDYVLEDVSEEGVEYEEVYEDFIKEEEVEY